MPDSSTRKSLKLRHRLVLSVGIFSAVMVLIVCLGYFFATRASKGVQDIYEETNSKTIMAVNLSNAYSKSIVSLVHKLTLGVYPWNLAGSQLKVIQKTIKENIEPLETSPMDADEKQLLDDVSSKMDSANAIVKELEPIIRKKDKEGLQSLAQRLYPSVEPVGYSVQQFLDYELNRSKEMVEAHRKDFRSSYLWIASVALAGALVISILAVMLLQHYIAHPLRQVSDRIRDIVKGNGDLTKRVEVHSDDEIGEVAKAFNSFADMLQTMLLRVLDNSQHLSEQVQSMTHSTAEVSAMSEDVTTTIQQISKGAEEQASKINEVNQLMQEVQETMKEVEMKAHETSKAVDQATQTAKVGGRLARGTIDKMVELNGIILENSKMVGHLGLKSKEVGVVVEIISNIAEQTNLLSLNAAIEAARAGEQGRGFTIVADEIRNLADGSRKAVGDITTLVQEMQDETSAVIKSMEKSSAEAQVGKEGIHQMEGALDGIVTVIENVVGHSKKITEMINAQGLRFTQIVHSIQDINAVSEESAASTEEVSASTEEQSASMEQINATFKELAALSQELKSMVEKFKIR